MIMLLAISTLHPGHIAAWLAVGLLVGWLSGKVIETDGYGLGGSLVFGALGAVVGGGSARLLLGRTDRFWMPVLAALLGACIFTCVARVILGRLSR
jgi:uncharacterized membrane protein YeaQ/YmgE (transglycosylase-associated protein family)